MESGMHGNDLLVSLVCLLRSVPADLYLALAI